MTKIDHEFGPAPASGGPGKTIPCPDCAEAIPVSAVSCRYCGFDLCAGAYPESDPAAEAGEAAAEREWDDAFASLARQQNAENAGGTVPRRPARAIALAAVVLALICSGGFVLFSGPDIEPPREETIATGALAKRQPPPEPAPAAKAEGRASATDPTPAAPATGRGLPEKAGQVPSEPPERAAGMEPLSTADDLPPAPPETGEEPGAGSLAAADMPDIGDRQAGNARVPQTEGPETAPPPESVPAVSIPGETGTALSRQAGGTAGEPDAGPPAKKAERRVTQSSRVANRAAGGGATRAAARDSVTAVGDLVAWVQSELTRRGFYDGPVDGRAGTETRAAIRAYQLDRKMTPTGSIDQTLTTSLRHRPVPGVLSRN